MCFLTALAIGFVLPTLAEEQNTVDPKVRQEIEAVLVSAKKYGRKYPATLRRTANDFAGGKLSKRQGAAGSYQRGSRNPRPPDALAFCLRYSA